MSAAWRVAIAPMLDHSDRHFRWLVRRLTRRAVIYGEMTVTSAILHGDVQKLLGFDPAEKPIAAQLGGDDPRALATCARIVEDLGWDEVNLNVGCPSDRVRAGAFGAVLMRTPERVAEAVAAMKAAVAIPVTVKHRIGVDEADAYEDLLRFVDAVAPAGCDRFVVHARKAVLGGLSPKQNREVPPLRPGDVVRLKRERPALAIELNGGIRTVEQVLAHRDDVDGVMIGRAAIETPWALAELDARVFGDPGPRAFDDVLGEVAGYLARHAAEPGFRQRWVLRHVLAWRHGVPGAARWRRILAEGMDEPGVLDRARAALG